jgi:uncharacterized repeat protein (TIGR03803 family)
MGKTIQHLATVFLLTACLLPNFSFAQYIKLLDFAGPSNGSTPHGSLIQASDGMLYGLTYVGGAYNHGVLFQYNPAANTYTKKINFAGYPIGQYPYGSLMQASDGMLYGLTSGGGSGINGLGVLFQYNPADNTYTDKINFAYGTFPYGSLMQASDGMLYGMTRMGGVNNLGVLFQYNPANNTYTNKLDFDGTTNGSTPWGSLMQASDGMLYGMTCEGGANNLGVLFQYNPTANTYTKKVDFDGTTNGRYPYGSLIQASDGMLYGLTYAGGANGVGVLFQYNPATNTYTDKFDFDGTTNGGNPAGDLMQASDGMLYGFTSNGDNWGVLFQYNPATNTYTNKFDFGGTTNGSDPEGSLMQASDGMLYGMTAKGGTISTSCEDGCGTLFKYQIATTGIAENNLAISFNVYPNPFTSQTTITFTQEQKNTTIKIMDVLGKEIRSLSFTGKQIIIEKNEMKEGIYFVEIYNGGKIHIVKIVIQ